MISIRMREPIPRKRKKDGCGSIADNAHDKEEDDKKEYFSVTPALKMPIYHCQIPIFRLRKP